MESVFVFNVFLFRCLFLCWFEKVGVRILSEKRWKVLIGRFFGVKVGKEYCGCY